MCELQCKRQFHTAMSKSKMVSSDSISIWRLYVWINLWKLSEENVMTSFKSIEMEMHEAIYLPICILDIEIDGPISEIKIKDTQFILCFWICFGFIQGFDEFCVRSGLWATKTAHTKRYHHNQTDTSGHFCKWRNWFSHKIATTIQECYYQRWRVVAKVPHQWQLQIWKMRKQHA